MTDENDIFDDYCPKPEEVYNLVGPEGDLKVPDKFDFPVIEREIEKIKNSPSVLANYMRQLRARFNTKSQVNVINALEKYNQAISSGIQSQTAITRSRTELLEAQKELIIAESDYSRVSDEVEIKEHDRQIEKLDRQILIEKKKREIEEIKQPPEEKDEFQALREKLEKERIINEIFDHHEREKLIIRLKKYILRSVETQKAMEEICHEFFGGKAPEELEGQEKNLFAFIMDLYKKFIARNL